MPGIKGTMHEFSEGKLHSGSKKGPVVKSRKQAIAIGLSEERKEGHHVAPKHHSFASTDIPYGHATEGTPNEHQQPVGHMAKAEHHSEKDGAGRHGADESGHRHYSEHKTPHHPDKKAHTVGYTSEGVMGHPGEIMRMGHDGGGLVGGNYDQTAHEPAVLKTPDGQGFTAGHPGITTGGMGKPHGYGHQAHQKSGVHRNSGHPGAHRIGKR